jgi:phage major head subunit gpT-like protein
MKNRDSAIVDIEFQAGMHQWQSQYWEIAIIIHNGTNIIDR